MIYGVSFRTKDFLLSSASVESNKIDAHIHKYYEFLYLIEGEGTYIIGNKSYTIVPGDIILTPPDVMHVISFSSDMIYSRVFIQLSPAFLSSIPRNLVRNINERLKYENCVIHKDTAEKFNLYHYFEQGAELLHQRNERNTYMARLLFSEFAVKLNDALELDRKHNADYTENNVVVKIKAYLDRHFTEDINLDAISKKLYISKYHICHIFKTETGITVADYIALKRISAVRENIADNLSVTDVYRQCGFNDYSTLYRTVKKYTGMKPSEFYG